MIGRDAPALLPQEQQDVVHGLNEVIKNQNLPEARELRGVTNDPGFQERVARELGELPARRREWSGQEARR